MDNNYSYTESRKAINARAEIHRIIKLSWGLSKGEQEKREGKEFEAHEDSKKSEKMNRDYRREGVL